MTRILSLVVLVWAVAATGAAAQGPSGPNPQTAGPLVKRWEFVTGDLIVAAPAVGADGTVYVASRDHRLYALSGVSGAGLWQFETWGWLERSPVPSVDGLVFLGSSEGVVYALDAASGRVRWKHRAIGAAARPEDLPENQDPPPAFGSRPREAYPVATGPDGSVVVLDAKIRVLDGRTGKQRWEIDGGPGCAFSPRGTVLYGFADPRGEPDRDWHGIGIFCALDSRTGSVRWRWHPALHVPGVLTDGPKPVAVDAAGTLYLVGRLSERPASAAGPPAEPPAIPRAVLMAVTPSRELKWSCIAERRGFAAGASIGPNGLVYCGLSAPLGARAGGVLALDAATGKEAWFLPTGQDWATRVAVGPPGVLYFGSGHSLYAVDAGTGRLLWTFGAEGNVGPPVLGPGGWVYFAVGSKLYALGPASPADEGGAQ